MTGWFGRKKRETSIAVDSDASSGDAPLAAGPQTRTPWTGLPVPTTRLVGRAAEVQTVCELARKDRLVTLTGPGGIGKTRLAIAVAEALREEMPGGVCMADLSGVADPRLVATTVAAAAGLPDEPGRTALQSLQQHLGEVAHLIVVDNCEHLIAAAAEVVDFVLQHCPEIRILATSREPLQVQGEVIWRVPPLPVPREGNGIAASGAADLFLERAVEARPGYVPNPEEQEAIAAIARRLDGLPLGLELAAARLRHLSVQEIAGRLDDRFRLLTGGSRTALPRQRTLEAAIRWSYDLLTRVEQRVFDRLSVFAGSFNLDAVESLAPASDGDVLDVVSELVDKSLVAREQVDGLTRYRILETLRAFGRERLLESGDAAPARSRHLHWVGQLAASASGQMDGPKQSDWLATLDRELDNVRGALTWAIESPAASDRGAGLTATTDLYRYWWMRSVADGRYFLEGLIRGMPESELPSQAIFVRGVLAGASGNFESAVESLRASLASFEAAGDRRGVALASHWLARYSWTSEQADRLKALLEASTATFREVNDVPYVALSLVLLAAWHIEAGQSELAQPYIDEFTQLSKRIGAPNLLAHAAELEAIAASELGDLPNALMHFSDALSLYREINNLNCCAHCIDAIAYLAVKQGKPDEATVLLGSGASLRQKTGVPVPPYESFMYHRTQAICHRELTQDQFDLDWAQGMALDYPGALERARGRLTDDPR